jgi:hypothetical protein
MATAANADEILIDVEEHTVIASPSSCHNNSVGNIHVCSGRTRSSSKSVGFNANENSGRPAAAGTPRKKSTTRVYSVSFKVS